MSESQLAQLASIKGIDPNYTDAWGNQTQTSPEVVEKILTAMGCNTSPDQLGDELAKATSDELLRPLPYVTLVYQDETPEIAVTLPSEQLSQSLRYQITTETGQSIKGKWTISRTQLVETKLLDGQQLHVYRLPLPTDIALGYHSISLFAPRARTSFASGQLIIAPRACFTPPAIASGKRIWGVSVQLYAVRSKTNWGIGDFSDLKQLLTNIKNQGGDFVGLNPIHALYPSMPNNASPYSPSSRQWLNVIYIDVNAVPEFNQSPAAQALFHSPEFQQKLTQARTIADVDYRLVHELKLSSLRLAFEQLISEGGARLEKLNQFVTEQGDSLTQQAVFDALHHQLIQQDSNAWGWPAWPQQLQDYHTDDVKKWHQTHPQEVLFWSYLQWLASDQLQQADDHAKQLKMEIGIYRDLAVGVAAGGCETWANKGDYCTQASVGAPPDILGPLGQNWGLPPLEPNQLIQQGFAPFIKLLQANMQACGALRIDHVMALLRLWWIPQGETAANGVYVYYPVNIMLAILALESQRNQCLIIGEDLGTVPAGMDTLLKDSGVYSYRVFCFETAEDGGYISPQHYPEQAMSTVTTHDMPTLKGYWHCDDLTLGHQLGLYPTQELVDQLTAERHQSKQRMLDSLFGHQSLPEDMPRSVDHLGMDRRLNHGIQQHVATASSLLLSLQLEDFLEMEKPVNVPGTSDEYPNWRRKLSNDLDDLFSQPHIQQLCRNITQARQQTKA